MNDLELGTFYKQLEPNNRTLEELEVGVVEALEIYKKRRDEVIQKEKKSESPDEDSIRSEREVFALEVARLYNFQPNPEQFEKNFRSVIKRITDKYGKDPDEYLLDASLFPASLQDPNIRSPIESTRASLENLKRIAEIAEAVSPDVEGFLVSGSQAYGPFFSVKSNREQLYREYGVEPSESTEVSDIDGMMVVSDYKDLSILVNDLILKEICSPQEEARINKFQELHTHKEVDAYSFRHVQSGIEESFHIFDETTLSKIGSESSNLPNDKGITYVRDFRPNKPSKETRGYYKLIGLSTGEEVHFPVTIEREVLDNTGMVLGYISRTPIGGFRNRKDTVEYYPSVVINFLLQSPMVVIDKNGKVDTIISRAMTSLVGKLHIPKEVHLYRNQRMPRILLRELAKSLTNDHAEKEHQ